MKIDLLKSNHRRSAAEVIARVAWNAAWKLTCAWTPRFLNPWRLCVLRAFGAKIGRRTLVFGSVRIDMPWNLEIGDFSAIGRRAWLYNFARIRIGKNTIISQDTVLCTASHDHQNPYLPLFSKPIHVADQAWVAADCMVLPGVTVGEGAVIGARSVVTKDMPAWMVCAGNPCKPLKERKLRVDGGVTGCG